MVTCPSCSADQTETSKFCSECGAALLPEFAATMMYEPGASPAEGSAHLSKSDSSHHGRFLPGAKVGDRYRIVSLAGKGGMGEVYRADDLKLGHTVALKFLPRNLADDPERLEYFHSEVRLTRQISHPSVCRVYDISEVDGQHFLSMEYIDGEDLKILLRRIGRLPNDKGVQIALQLCAGLAAAHDRGVLHRDLKPANIMIDGRGQVRITDFGLAKLAGDNKEGEIAGTPAYMAPEQLARGETNIQSDLYSLGLILFELFTGQAAQKSGSIPELLRAHEESSVSQPSSLVGDIDPAVERVIMRCLDREPRQRPKSAHAVSASLPGGNPLEAALAAGETPSPEMVAASGGAGGLDAKVAAGMLAAVTLGLLVFWLLSDVSLVNRAGLEKHPEVLASRTREILNTFDYGDSPVDSASGFEVNNHYLNHVARTNRSADRWDGLSNAQPPGVVFWYRHSPLPLMSNAAFHDDGRRNFGHVTYNDPPLMKAGMINVRLDPLGRLLDFRTVPRQREIAPESAKLANSDPFDKVLLEKSADLLGFSLAEFSAVDSEWTPPMAFDKRIAWTGTYPDSTPIRVEAAGFHGKLVSLQIVGEWTQPDRDVTDAERGQSIAQGVFSALFLALFIASFFVAIYNLRNGRGDRHGAMRIALWQFGIVLLIYLLGTHHSHSPKIEGMSFQRAVAWGAFQSILLWLMYVALEPTARRFWPTSLITWSRVLSGRFRDPMVGQHLVIGVIGGVLGMLLIRFGDVWGEWFREPEPIPLATFHSLAPLMGIRFSIAHMLAALAEAVGVGFLEFFFLAVLRLVLRNAYIAAAAFVLMILIPYTLALNLAPIHIALFGTMLCIYVTVLIRYGLFAFMTLRLTIFLLSWPITTDASAWYSGIGLGGLLAVVAIAAYGSYRSLARSGIPQLKQPSPQKATSA